MKFFRFTNGILEEYKDYIKTNEELIDFIENINKHHKRNISYIAIYSYKEFEENNIGIYEEIKKFEKLVNINKEEVAIVIDKIGNNDKEITKIDISYFTSYINIIFYNIEDSYEVYDNDVSVKNHFNLCFLNCKNVRIINFIKSIYHSNLNNKILSSLIITKSEVKELIIDYTYIKNFNIDREAKIDKLEFSNASTIENLSISEKSYIKDLYVLINSTVKSFDINEDSKISNLIISEDAIIEKLTNYNVVYEDKIITKPKSTEDKISRIYVHNSIENIKISNCYFYDLIIRSTGKRLDKLNITFYRIYVKGRLYVYKLGNRDNKQKNNVIVKIEDCRFNIFEMIWCKIKNFEADYTTIDKMVINNINVIKFTILDSLIENTIISNLALLNNLDKNAYIYFQDTSFNKYNMQYIKWYNIKEKKDYENIVHNIANYSEYVLDSIEKIKEDINKINNRTQIQKELEILSNLKNTYTLIKTSYNQHNNHVASEKIATLEKYIYEEELRQNKKEPLLDKFLFCLNNVVSNHNQSLIKVLGWYLFFSSFFLILGNKNVIIHFSKHSVDYIMLVIFICIILIIYIGYEVVNKKLRKLKPVFLFVVCIILVIISGILLNKEYSIDTETIITIISEWLYPLSFKPDYENLYYMPIFLINMIFHTYFLYQVLRITHKLFR